MGGQRSGSTQHAAGANALVYKHFADGSMGGFQTPPCGYVPRDGVLGVPRLVGGGRKDVRNLFPFAVASTGRGGIWALLWLARSSEASQPLCHALPAQRRPEARVRGRNPPSLSTYPTAGC